MSKCLCGCGHETKLFRNKPNKYLFGHHLFGNKHSLGRKPTSTSFKKGLIPWNKGLLGYRAGEFHHNWKGGVTTPSRLDRIKFKNYFQKKVFERDNYTCQLCGEKGHLQVDHIQPWSEYVEGRFELSNCRTLRMSCHYQITFGKPMPPTVKAWGHNLSKGGNDL